MKVLLSVLVHLRDKEQTLLIIPNHNRRFVLKEAVTKGWADLLISVWQVMAVQDLLQICSNPSRAGCNIVTPTGEVRKGPLWQWS